MTIAYLGPAGTFTEQAVRTFPEADAAQLVPIDGVAAALDAVRAGTADAACVPVENSVEGSVSTTLDALDEDTPLVAVRETVLPIRFCVLVRPGSVAADVATVATHPHAAAQVRGWLATHVPTARLVPTYSTAAAAVAVVNGEVDAAVTAPVARSHYDLDVLAADVADVADARTRFLLVRRPGPPLPPTGDDRTSVVAVTADRTGALFEVLAEFALRDIGLTRIESRPTRDRLGEYRFFLDCAGHVADPPVGEALAALRRRCTRVRFLGSYPRSDGGPPPAPEAREHRDATAWVRGLLEGRS